MHFSEIWHRFYSEQSYGKYAVCRYPNLAEIFGYFPTYYFAEVMDELVPAVFRNEEDLTREEMQKIAYYNGWTTASSLQGMEMPLGSSQGS